MSLPPSTRIALAISLLLTALFSAWALQALGDGPLPAFDRDIAQAFREAAQDHRLRREFMVMLTILGSVPTMAFLALVGGAWQWRRGDRTLAIAWLAIVIAGGLLDMTLKKSLDRPRPPADWRDPAVHESNESFPSGHSMGSTIGYGMLGYVALQSTRRRRTKSAILLFLAAGVLLIGFSRIYLRAHWFSDVIGGFTVGAAWLLFGLALLIWIQHRASPRMNEVNPGGPPGPQLDSPSAPP